MVNIIENWSNIKGTFLSVKKHKKLDNHLQISLKLASTEDVESFPNLATLDIGKKILVNIPSEMKKETIANLEKELFITVRKVFGEEYFIKKV